MVGNKHDNGKKSYDIILPTHLFCLIYDFLWQMTKQSCKTDRKSEFAVKIQKGK